MANVVVVGIGRAAPGKEAEVEAAMRKIVAASHGEEGCVRYTVNRDSDDPARFVMIEVWRSREDLDAHFQTPHVAELVATFDRLDGAPQIIFLEPLPEGDATKGSLA